MRKSFVFALLLSCGFAAAQNPPTPLPDGPAPKPQTAPDNSPFKTLKERVSYALGLSIGSSLRKDSIDVDPSVLLQGINDARSGNKPLMTEDQLRNTMVELQIQLQNQQAAKKQANKKEGDTFLAQNKTKPGVITLPSGLQYKIITAGTGPKPARSDSVTCNYRGTFINGTEFDSSYKRGEATTFSLTGVIPGWTEALQLMPVGSKWQLFVPSDLAYGEPGREGIEPNTTLIFEVELLAIVGKQDPAAPPKN
jgi:FKBP-type peptidyl-prolyl cis-trans isomerase FklB